jgi:tripartite-type tricarboxylate transporter receptor subunit TctC
MADRLWGAIARLAILGSLAVLSGAAATEEAALPAKPVRVLVPFSPGGAVDIVARTIGDEFSRRWGQTVVIEKRPGAAGIDGD